MKDHELEQKECTLSCYYCDSNGEVIEGWEEDLPNEEVAANLFNQMVDVSDEFEYTLCIDES